MAPADEPQQPAASEEAFLKGLKSMAMYTDMFTNAAASIDTKRSDPAAAAKTLTSMVPALAKEGVGPFLLRNAVTAADLLKTKGTTAHPAVRFYAEECAKLNENDFRDLAKPLRLFVQAVQKSKLPAPQAPRGWVGDKKRTL
ncbi:MAG: hypothetical protein EPN97_11675 [Alphaproteobacteria bacterium]|nr:MAG: hypothetical protein EPN97_11675 [Alphaproteobacteria bacterium]